MDYLEALRLQWEWGADEALLEAPQNRFLAKTPKPESAVAPPARPAPRAVAAALPPGPAEAERLAAACRSLDELRAALERFTGCSLKDTATQLVFADGVAMTNLIFIGEAPGADEDRIGRPFVGVAGQLLDKMLASIGLDRSKIRIVNVVPWRPPGNRVPTDSEIAVCLPFLRRHIELVAPRCAVLLGAVAAKAFLPGPGAAGIRRLRGQWKQLEWPGLAAPIACLPTYHPAYLLRTPSAKRESWHDLIALQQWLNDEEV
jgi:DNA polymerase